MNRYIYVDNSSTTRLNESVLYKMLPYLKKIMEMHLLRIV